MHVTHESGIRCRLRYIFPVALFFVASAPQANAAGPVSDDVIRSTLPGVWCLNSEAYGEDVSYDGARWRFEDDGEYFTSVDSPAAWKYEIRDGQLILENYGTMSVLELTPQRLVTRIASTYHFTRDTCLPETLAAQKLTELNAVILSGDLDAARKMIDASTDISSADTRTTFQSTPLMMAVKSGSSEMVEYILSLKPDLRRTNGRGQTARDVADQQGTGDIKRIIHAAYGDE